MVKAVLLAMAGATTILATVFVLVWLGGGNTTSDWEAIVCLFLALTGILFIFIAFARK